MATFFDYKARAPSFEIFDSLHPIKNFGGNQMYYKNSDYTARTETRDGEMKYFIRFHGAVESPEVLMCLQSPVLRWKAFYGSTWRMHWGHVLRPRSGAFAYT